MDSYFEKQTRKLLAVLVIGLLWYTGSVGAQEAAKPQGKTEISSAKDSRRQQVKVTLIGCFVMFYHLDP